MKKFKQLLSEIKVTPPPSGRGGGSGSDDHHREIMNFMGRIPFRLNTRQGDLIHFDSALNAARSFFKHLEQHEEGHDHAVQTETSHMVRYFQKSAQTHEDALDLVKDMVENHKDLPVHLRSKIGSSLSRLQLEVQDEHEEKRKSMGNIGEIVMRNYNARPVELRGEDFHPYQHDQMHHLEGVVGDLEDDMDEAGAPLGYVVRRKEQNDM